MSASIENSLNSTGNRNIGSHVEQVTTESFDITHKKVVKMAT